MNRPPTAGPGDKTWSLAKIMRTYLVSVPTKCAGGASLTEVSARGSGPVVLQFGRLGEGLGVDNNHLTEYRGRHTRARRQCPDPHGHPILMTQGKYR